MQGVLLWKLHTLGSGFGMPTLCYQPKGKVSLSGYKCLEKYDHETVDTCDNKNFLTALSWPAPKMLQAKDHYIINDLFRNHEQTIAALHTFASASQG